MKIMLRTFNFPLILLDELYGTFHCWFTQKANSQQLYRKLCSILGIELQWKQQFICAERFINFVIPTYLRRVMCNKSGSERQHSSELYAREYIRSIQFLIIKMIYNDRSIGSLITSSDIPAVYDKNNLLQRIKLWGFRSFR